MMTAISFGIVTVAQFCTMILFFVKTRKLKEINFLPKAMMLMASASTVFYFIGYTFLLIYDEDEIKIMFYLAIIFRFADMVNYVLLFRLIRVQN